MGVVTAAGEWVPVSERLPPLTDEGWRKESAYVLVRFDNGRGAQWCRGHVAVYPPEEEYSEPVQWRTDGENWDISGVTHWAEVTL